MRCSCGSVYGQTVNVRDGGKAEWKCRDCAKVQPWVEPPLNERLLTANVEMGAKLTDALVLLRRWLQDGGTDELRKETAEFLDEKHWMAGK